jgi:hypothetical protein
MADCIAGAYDFICLGQHGWVNMADYIDAAYDFICLGQHG